MSMYVEYHNTCRRRACSRARGRALGRGEGIVPVIESSAPWVASVSASSGRSWTEMEGARGQIQVVSLDADYIKLRINKSDEEIAWLLVGARSATPAWRRWSRPPGPA